MVMRHSWFPRTPLLLLTLASTAACSGLVAGPESSNVTPVPASRDSVYVRARRALSGESFTVDVADSTHGRFTAIRFPSSSAVLGSSAKCRVAVALQLSGNGQQSQVATTSRWIAPEQMSDKAPKLCEQERSEVLERMAAVLNPPPAMP
jgi:hypothetical protein